MESTPNPIDEIKSIFTSRTAKSNLPCGNDSPSGGGGSNSTSIPQDPEKRYWYYLEQKNWNQALIQLESLSQGIYTEDDLFFKKIKLLTNLKKYRDASSLVMQRIKTKTPNSKYFFVLSRILYEEGDFHRALDYIQKAVNMESGKVIYLYWLGIVEKKHGLLEQAKQSFSRALQYEKDSVKIQYQLATVLFELHDYSRAIPIFEGLQSNSQLKSSVIWYLAHSYQQIRDDQKANHYFQLFKELHHNQTDSQL